MLFLGRENVPEKSTKENHMFIIVLPRPTRVLSTSQSLGWLENHIVSILSNEHKCGNLSDLTSSTHSLGVHG